MLTLLEPEVQLDMYRDPVRILVTGSRSWGDAPSIYSRLDQAFKVLGGDAPVTLVHGACMQGADKLADDWAKQRARDGWAITVERHPAEWGKYGRSAGPMRNQEMVNLGASVCLAFIRDASRGATGCASMASRAGIMTIITEWESR